LKGLEREVGRNSFIVDKDQNIDQHQ